MRPERHRRLGFITRRTVRLRVVDAALLADRDGAPPRELTALARGALVVVSALCFLGCSMGQRSRSNAQQAEVTIESAANDGVAKAHSDGATNRAAKTNRAGTTNSGLSAATPNGAGTTGGAVGAVPSGSSRVNGGNKDALTLEGGSAADRQQNQSGAAGNDAPSAQALGAGQEASGVSRYPSGAGQWTPLALPDDGPRVYAKTRNVWVKGKPDSSGQWIGFLWFGSSVRLKSTEPVSGPGCSKWYAVEPRGYVCADGDRATIDPNDPVIAGLYRYGANVAAANPHPFYGESVDAQRYTSLPTPNTQSRREWDYRKRLERIAEARAGGDRITTLIGVDLTPADAAPPELPELPTTLQMPHRRLIARSTVAWMREAHFEGRDWLLTDDLTWVPKDRVKPYPEVEFQGLHLNDKVRFPLAFFRGTAAPKYRRDGDRLTETGDHYARLSWTALTSETLVNQEGTFYATTDGHWVNANEAVVPEPRLETPWGAKVGQPDTSEDAPRGRATWIDVSVLGGWLIAYEGTKPVFVTLISPGKGGVPQRGVPPLKTSATPTGRFKITGKFVTSTMIAPNDLTHSAVPWAQNFSGPYSLHGAYWHNDWGELKSGGCINLSPQDARFFFDWTEPQIPEGWHGVRWLPNKEASTTLLVGR